MTTTAQRRPRLTQPDQMPAPAASSTRRTAAGVKADRRSPAGLGLDTGEDRRTLATAGTANTQVHVHPDHVHNADESAHEVASK